MSKIDETYDLSLEIIEKCHIASRQFTGVEGIEETFVPRPRLGHEFREYFRPGLYLASKCSREGFAPNPVSLKEEEELFQFDCSARRQIRKEMNLFWDQKHESLKEGIAHRTGIAIHGPPGSGKSMFLKQEIRRLVDEGRVVFLVDSPWYMKESINKFRSMEPDRDLVVVIEDIDEVTRKYGEQIFLETMGGLESANNIMFIATTNDLHELSEKIRRRGRFDRKIELGLPDANLRFKYLEHKIRGRESSNRIAKIAKLTEGFSFGDLRDLHRTVYVYKMPLRESLLGIKSEITESNAASSKKRRKTLEEEEPECG